MTATDRQFVSQLGHQERVDQVFLASDKQLRPNRNGNLFIQVDLSDRSGSIPARMWNASDTNYREFDNGDYVHVDGATQLFQGSLQLIANRIRRARTDEVDEADFVTLQSDEVDQMAGRVAEILRGLRTPALRNLGECFLMDAELMAKFAKAPAAMRNHHAYHGGLLEHTLNLMELVLLVAPRYPEIDQDKLLVGAFLHDIAKIDELSYERDIAYTDAGQMLGHMVLGVSLVDDKIREAERLAGEPFPEMLGVEIKHLIVSHHGELEFGSPKLPMSVEAIALHLLDNLDAKINAFSHLIRSDANVDSNWTQLHTHIRRRLYKGAKKEE
jgi:3'-5' exoribonuclease